MSYTGRRVCPGCNVAGTASYFDDDGYCASCSTAAGSYARVYGAENPWVKWLQERAPHLATKSPRALRQLHGVPATPTPGFEDDRTKDLR